MLTKFTTEAIKHQIKDSFPPALSSLIGDMYRHLDANPRMDVVEWTKKCPHIKEMEQLIYNRFGIQVVVDPALSGLLFAGIIPFFCDHLRDFKHVSKVDPSTIIKYILNFDRERSIVKKLNEINTEYKTTIKQIHNKKGVVDLKHAKVTGYFSALRHYLILDIKSMKEVYSLTTDEVTAIILHELGHAFHGIESHYKVERTNESIQQVLLELNNNNVDRAEYIFKSKIASDEEFKLYMTSNRTRYDMVGAVAMNYLGTIRSQMVNSKYDETTFENLADEFTTRFGYGQELVNSLNKLHTLGGVSRGVLVSKDMAMPTGIMLYSLYLLGVFIAFPILGVGPISVLWATLCLSGIFFEQKEPIIYDFPIDRYTRVKNSVVNWLKNQKLPNEVIKDLLDQHNYISNIIESSEYFKSPSFALSEILTFSGHDNKYYRELQQDVEAGLNNMLFVKAATLKTS